MHFRAFHYAIYYSHCFLYACGWWYSLGVNISVPGNSCYSVYPGGLCEFFRRDLLDRMRVGMTFPSLSSGWHGICSILPPQLTAPGQSIFATPHRVSSSKISIDSLSEGLQAGDDISVFPLCNFRKQWVPPWNQWRTIIRADAHDAPACFYHSSKRVNRHRDGFPNKWSLESALDISGFQRVGACPISPMGKSRSANPMWLKN